MKKFSILFITMLMFATAAQAETIVVIDQNGNVVRQMFTSPTTYNAPQVVTTAPAQTVTVVRESPVIQQSYYYDRSATNAALAAGVTTAIVGGLLFDGFRGYHHHHHHHHGGWRPGRHHR